MCVERVTWPRSTAFRVTIEQSLDIDRERYSDLLLEQIPTSTDIVVLNLMRLVGGTMLSQYRDRIINTHPSLLPAYPGYGANRKLLSEGRVFSGGAVVIW